MSPRWEAIALSRIRRSDLVSRLAELGIEWDQCGHVTATRSLSRAIEEQHNPAISTSTLIDFAVLPGLPGHWRLDPPDLVPPSDEGSAAARQAVIREWQGRVSGRTLRMDLRIEGVLRRLVREGGIDARIGRSLVAGRRTLIKGIRQLIASGFRPDDVLAGDPTVDAATTFWRQVETEVPAIAQVRTDMWVDDDEIAALGPDVGDIRSRLLRAIDATLGTWSTDRTILHHGFHFYTPVQWALFRLLRDLCDVSQIFIIHDDGESPVFEPWRRFFDPSLEMPVVTPPLVERMEPAPAATALRSALSGRPVDVSAASGRLDIYRCRNVAELARLIRPLAIDADTSGRKPPEMFAPSSDDIERSVRRLAGQGDQDRTDIGHLPVGTFLIGLHRCIDRDGRPRIEGADLLDLAATGLLGPGTPDADDTALLAAVRRALPFFEDCVLPAQWLERAALLVDLVDRAVRIGGGRDVSSDLARINSAAANPLLRIPWLDLSSQQAQTVRATIQRVVKLVTSIASVERIRFGDHLDFIEKTLRESLASASPEEQARLQAQIDGLSAGLDEEVDVEGLVDVVHILLGREMESDLLGDAPERATGVEDLLSLDARGFWPREHDIHVTNLSDRSFPRRAPGLPWPFRLESLAETGGLGIASDILQTRAETGPASDLYLLWLALDGVTGSARVQLSFVERLRGEPQNRSSVLSLLTRPTSLSDAIADHVAGVPVREVPGTDEAAVHPSMPKSMPDVLGDISDVEAAQARLLDIDHRAVAAGEMCPRRLALQWLFGESAAHMAGHHQAMLYGNVFGALVIQFGLPSEEAQEICDQVWAHLTAGQRRSSMEKRVVKQPGADPAWVLTLAGSKRRTDAVSRAYKLARMESVYAHQDVRHIADEIVTSSRQLLPLGIDPDDRGAPAVCDACPVRSRCRSRVFETR